MILPLGVNPSPPTGASRIMPGFARRQMGGGVWMELPGTAGQPPASQTRDWRLHSVRKTKEIKRKKINAGIEYKKGNRKDAYKMWADAKKEIDELRGRNKPAAEKAPAESTAE